MRLLLLLLLLVATVSLADVKRIPEGFLLTCPRGEALLSGSDGSLLELREAGRDSVLASGEDGLWKLRFEDGHTLAASEFGGPKANLSFEATIDEAAGALRLEYRGPEGQVRVSLVPYARGFELTGEVAFPSAPVLDFQLPARLRFATEGLHQVVVPEDGNQGVGYSLLRQWFERQPQERPSAWTSEVKGGEAYTRLVGEGVGMGPVQDTAVPLTVTDQGKAWLPEATVALLGRSMALSNRPSPRGRSDVILVDSSKGPWFAGTQLGGTGWLWRPGGGVGENEAPLLLATVTGVLDKLSEVNPQAPFRVGLISLERGPEQGSWAYTKVAEWQQQLTRWQGLKGRRIEIRELQDLPALQQALGEGQLQAIINPYGESLPAFPEEQGGFEATIDAIASYVKAGGSWFETGGYPFFSAMKPVLYYGHQVNYPAAFSDFFHVATEQGQVALFRVAPRTWDAWAGAADPTKLFVPGRLAFGADEQGGWAEHTFCTWVKEGETWRAPLVHLQIGQGAEQALEAYREANALTVPLAAKFATPEACDAFRKAVLLYLGGTAEAKTAYLDKLPSPTYIHFADYLKGGFDKQYPDHLPPASNFGTSEQFHALFDRAHELGHLVVPYTNPTWWCDHPKGPTFEAAGEEPLLKHRDGTANYERYAANDGWTITFWHPAVQAANRKTRSQFSEDYSVDVLFQDQCGARGWQYDFNPASPTPAAYSDGLISLVQEDSKVRPLSTEAGWDGVLNYEAQLCGLSWSLVPTAGGPEWRTLKHNQWAPETWRVYPLAQRVAHQGAAMLYHDLGQFVTNDETLAWTLGLGFSLSYRLQAAERESDAPLEWLRWLDRLQKSVIARYVGEAVGSFEHDRTAALTPADDGILRATYGPVEVIANLGPAPYEAEGFTLAGKGFLVKGPGVFAANLATDDETGLSFLWEKEAKATRLWVYEAEGRQVEVLLPEWAPPARSLLDDEDRELAKAVGRTLTFNLPTAPGASRVLAPPQLANLAPIDWKGPRPVVAVINLPGLAGAWSTVSPDQWLEALGKSSVASLHGLAVVKLETPEQVIEALEGGPARCLAIINPYGEVFPTLGPSDWKQMLARIRGYVENGGSWWETGGYSFHSAAYPTSTGWAYTAIGPQGLAEFGLPIGGGEIDQAPEQLSVPREGRAILGEALADELSALSSTVNRALPSGAGDPGHITLAAGQGQDYIGGYRLQGWGWLWRVGGFNPNPEVLVPLVTRSLEWLYTSPAPEVKSGGIKRLWSFKLR